MSRGSIWFAAFLADRGTRKPSLHTMKAYRQGLRRDRNRHRRWRHEWCVTDVAGRHHDRHHAHSFRAVGETHEALSSVDVLSVCPPHPDDTRKLLNAGRLARPPHGVLVIIVGRGEVIVERRCLPPFSRMHSSEATNTHLRALTKRAYGFHSPDALIAMALLTRGGLCPPPPGRAG
jgi:hypothetical protein